MIRDLIIRLLGSKRINESTNRQMNESTNERINQLTNESEWTNSRHLRIWNAGRELRIFAAKVCHGLPREEEYRLKDQICWFLWLDAFLGRTQCRLRVKRRPIFFLTPFLLYQILLMRWLDICSTFCTTTKGWFHHLAFSFLSTEGGLSFSLSSGKGKITTKSWSSS